MSVPHYRPPRRHSHTLLRARMPPISPTKAIKAQKKTDRQFEGCTFQPTLISKQKSPTPGEGSLVERTYQHKARIERRREEKREHVRRLSACY